MTQKKNLTINVKEIIYTHSLAIHYDVRAEGVGSAV